MVVGFRRCEALRYRTGTEQNRTCGRSASSQAGTPRLHVKDHQRWVGCINTSALYCVPFITTPHPWEGRSLQCKHLTAALLLYYNRWVFAEMATWQNVVNDREPQVSMAGCLRASGSQSNSIQECWNAYYVCGSEDMTETKFHVLLLHLSKNGQHVHSGHSCILSFFLS